MTVIAWDGKTLAADKRCDSQGTITVTTKIKKIRDHLVGGSGGIAECREMFSWFENGASIENYPSFQNDKERWVPLVVITPDRKILRYEQTPYPYEIEQMFYAAGSGRDYALGAMAMKATASQAVLVASEWDSGCGNGVDTLGFE